MDGGLWIVDGGLWMVDGGLWMVDGGGEKVGDTLATHVHAIVTTDDDDGGVDDGGAVDKQVNAGIAEELLGLGRAAEILMVSQAGIDGCLQPVEFLGHTFFCQGAHAPVDNVAGNEHFDPGNVFDFALDKTKDRAVLMQKLKKKK